MHAASHQHDTKKVWLIRPGCHLPPFWEPCANCKHFWQWTGIRMGRAWLYSYTGLLEKVMMPSLTALDYSQHKGFQESALHRLFCGLLIFTGHADINTQQNVPVLKMNESVWLSQCCGCYSCSDSPVTSTSLLLTGATVQYNSIIHLNCQQY